MNLPVPYNVGEDRFLIEWQESKPSSHFSAIDHHRSQRHSPRRGSKRTVTWTLSKWAGTICSHHIGHRTDWTRPADMNRQRDSCRPASALPRKWTKSARQTCSALAPGSPACSTKPTRLRPQGQGTARQCCRSQSSLVCCVSLALEGLWL